MMRKTSTLITAILAVALLLAGVTSCKPTEKNYKEAYDAARLKKQTVAAQNDSLADGHVLTPVDIPRKIESGNVTVFVVKNPLKYFAGAEDGLKKWNVAVACYSMPTNCRAQVEALAAKGFKSMGLQSPGPKYYVVAASFDDLGAAKAFISDYVSNHRPDEFIGLEESPLLLEY